MMKTSFRIGSGFDVHALVKGRDLVIGGVLIPHEKGLSGHSDADVLLHSICDSILGALGKGDIGDHFPDTDPDYKGISSRVLLERCVMLMTGSGYETVNIDCTVFAQKPRLGPLKSQMAEIIAGILQIEVDRVNIKATTTEELGFTGRKEGIAAHSTVLIQSIQEQL